jgi:Fic family protein
MSEAQFNHFDLKLLNPAFDSPLTDLIIELDHLRRKELRGTTHPSVFFQLKRLFHTLESIGSARIEGNNTTIAEYIETKLEGGKSTNQNIIEINNIEKAMTFIEDSISDYPINRFFLSQIHTLIVDGLTPPPQGEGDTTPGQYRKNNLKIHKSSHLPPDWIMVDDYMNELLEFIEQDDNAKYDLIKAAIAHHRFVWIHPFGNGNGRTVRLFTYAMLVKAGFNVNIGRIINPTAVFCSNRTDYYNYLAQADIGSKEGLTAWIMYVLEGLKLEIEKIDKLSDYTYLSKEILVPMLKVSVDRKYITELEAKVLRRVIDEQVIQADDIKDIFKGKSSSEISRQIKRLIDKKMLHPEQEGGRKYHLRFDNNFLMRSVITVLGEKGFLPVKD